MKKRMIRLIGLIGIIGVVFISNVGWTAGGNQDRPQGKPSGLPPEIAAACHGKSEQAACQVGGTFTGTCRMLQNQLACVLSQDDASADLKQQWDNLDRNHDGFLDVNEVRNEAGPRDKNSGENRQKGG